MSTILSGAGTTDLVVEIAWGADLTADPGTWTWTDITTDVRAQDQVFIEIGRADEASLAQPARCEVTLDNTSGDYSLGGQSDNYPNVRRGTPVRVTANHGAGANVLFQGSADGFTPRWDITGTDATVALSASGALRRLSQGASPLISSLRRAIIDLSDVLAYWPMEDGKNAHQFASGFDGQPPMVISGDVDLAAASPFDCSEALPTLKAAAAEATALTGTVPNYTATGEFQIRFLAEFPDSGLPVDYVLLRILTTGSARQWDFYYDGGGTLGLSAYDQDGDVILDSGAAGFNADGKAIRISIELEQVGADIAWQISTLEPYANVGGSFSTATVFGDQPLDTQTLGKITQVIVFGASTGDITIGHVVVQDAVTPLGESFYEFNANVGETAIARMTRLCAENATDLDIVGTTDVTMGPQYVATLLDLLRECERADGGLLYDGVSPGLTYVARNIRENGDVALTLAAQTGEVARSIDPVHDDQHTTNRVQVTRKFGSSVVYEDTTGPMGCGPGGIGIYDSSLTINTDDDARVGDYASWAVHQGTVEGYRHPNMSINLAHKPGLIDDWLDVDPSARVKVTGIDDVRTQHPPDDHDFLVEGYSQTIDRFQWDVELNLSPMQPWVVGEFAATTGDTSEYVLRTDTDGSTLGSGASAGATSLSVATASGPLWTTSADDFPLDLEIDGIRVTVTAVSGASSPQTFTVTGATVTKALDSGAAVGLWRTPVLGL